MKKLPNRSVETYDDITEGSSTSSDTVSGHIWEEWQIWMISGAFTTTRTNGSSQIGVTSGIIQSQYQLLPDSGPMNVVQVSGLWFLVKQQSWVQRCSAETVLL